MVKETPMMVNYQTIKWGTHTLTLPRSEEAKRESNNLYLLSFNIKEHP